MRITKLILENFANIYSAMNKKRIEIDFSKCQNNITIFLGPNGSGKTSILSELHPFANSGSMDIRSDINLILENHNGYKEIHIEDNGDLYIIKHHYLFKNKSKSVKSFFECNGEELNENGNVSSFKTMVNAYLGLEPELMRLMRLGSNVNGLIDMKTSNRKVYASKLFQDIDIYSSLYKKISDRYRITRNLIKSVADKIDKLKIFDINALEDENNVKKETIKSYQDNKDKLIGEINVIDSEINKIYNENDIKNKDDLIKEYNNIITDIKELQKAIKSYKMPIIITQPVSKLINEYNDLKNKYSSQKEVYKVKLDYNFMMLDTIMSDISELENQIENSSSNSRINELCDLLDELKDKLESYKNIKEIKETKEEYLQLLSALQNLDYLVGNLESFSNNAIKEVINLLLNGRSVERVASNNRKNIQKEIDNYKIQIANSKQENLFLPFVTYQLCNENECPYKDFYNNTINSTKGDVQKLMNKIETLEVADEIFESYSHIKKSLESISKFMKANKKVFNLLDNFNFEYVLKCIVNKRHFYNEDEITDKIAEIEEYNDYIEIKNKIKDIEKELDLVSKIEIDINKLNKKLYENNMKKVKIEEEIKDINEKISYFDNKVELYTELIQGIEYIDSLLKEIENKNIEKEEIKTKYNYLNKLSKEVEEKEKYKINKEELLKSVNFQIESLSKQIEENNYKLRDYKNYIEEKNKLEEEFDDIDTIRMALSPNTGLPVLFLQIYLNRCIMTINQMLNIAYDDLEISNFIINEKEFRIPYVKKGIEVPDITYASQGERSFLSLALSLALIVQTLDKYNIMLLDEVDATLDMTNRRHFISIIEKLISRTGAEQIFMISHNNMFDNYPVDVIMTGDVDIDNFKNINVIWKA